MKPGKFNLESNDDVTLLDAYTNLDHLDETSPTLLKSFTLLLKLKHQKILKII